MCKWCCSTRTDLKISNNLCLFESLQRFDAQLIPRKSCCNTHQRIPWFDYGACSSWTSFSFLSYGAGNASAYLDGEWWLHVCGTTWHCCLLGCCPSRDVSPLVCSSKERPCFYQMLVLVNTGTIVYINFSCCIGNSHCFNKSIEWFKLTIKCILYS